MSVIICIGPFWLTRLPEVYLIYFRLLGEKGKPIIVCDGNETLHFKPILVSEKLARQTYGGLAQLGL